MKINTIFIINSENNKIKRKPDGFRSIIQQFCLNTSAHGIPGIVRSQSIKNRIFWSVCFTIFASITIYFIIQEIRNYFSYSTKTSINVVNEWPQAFPAFTFCNLAPVRYDRFIGPFLNYMNSFNLTKFNETDTISSYLAPYIPQFFQTSQNQNRSLTDFFFPLNSMLINCTFNGHSCSSVQFTSFYSSSYGLCYTYNAKSKNNSNVLASYEHGGIGKLSLRLYVHSHLHVPYIREGTGMIAMLHENTELPLIEYAGFTLSTGFRHRITYRKKVITYLHAPYSTCDDKIPAMMKAMFDNYQGTEYSYSQDLCYGLCTDIHAYLRCGCIDPMKWNSRWIYLPAKSEPIFAPLCNITDSCYVQANYDLYSSTYLIEKHCWFCPPQCSITNFIMKTSMSKAPPSWLLDNIKRFVEGSQMPLPNDWTMNWHTHIDSSYLSIDVLLQSTLVEYYSQIATMSPIDVLSNVGGQTGLWIGVSFLSLMEFAEMLYRLIRHEFNTFKRRKSKANDDSEV